MQITITQAHIRLLRRLEFDWDDAIEFGAVCSDFKRPYGNSGVLEDIAEILQLPVDEDGKPTDLTWGQARRLTAELAGIVNYLIDGLDAIDVVGDEVDLPWRADRTTKPHGLDLGDGTHRVAGPCCRPGRNVICPTCGQPAQSILSGGES